MVMRRGLSAMCWLGNGGMLPQGQLVKSFVVSENVSIFKIIINTFLPLSKRDEKVGE